MSKGAEKQEVACCVLRKYDTLSADMDGYPQTQNDSNRN